MPSAQEINSEIKTSRAKWVAIDSPLTSLSIDEIRQQLLGYTPAPEDPPLLFKEKAALSNSMTESGLKKQQQIFGLPVAYDLRSDGYVTSIKDQRGCGSCVAFGVLATVESSMRKQSGKPQLDVDYSEAHLFYCHGADEGRDCQNGWWPQKALEAIKTKGIVDEACFPYTAYNQPCKLCTDWESRTTKIKEYTKFTSVTDMKQHLIDKGALAATLSVYQDFLSYSSGVYKHVTGQYVGGHQVCIVGYDDNQQCWIGKNSWGTDWGIKGFFLIGYGQCGIDYDMYGVKCDVGTPPPPKPELTWWQKLLEWLRNL